jgi:uncharacterized protein (TIGR02246 family)
MDSLLEELVAIERSALDGWIQLDPSGYLRLFVPEVTYFDPTTNTRLNGLEAMRMRLAPIKELKLPFTHPRYEMIDPKVQRHGDVAILTFNLINYGRPEKGKEKIVARWNSTEVYSRMEGKWRIIHSHWSCIKPQPKTEGP